MCLPGPSGDPGRDGQNGPPGPWGPNGIQGEMGRPGNGPPTQTVSLQTFEKKANIRGVYSQI